MHVPEPDAMRNTVFRTALIGLLIAACGDAPAAPAIPVLGPLTELEASLRHDALTAHRQLVAHVDDVACWIALGRVMDRCEVPGVSEGAWAGAAALQPDSGEWPYLAGVAAIGASEPALAQRWFETCLAIDERDRHAWRQLGSLALDGGDLAAARTAFETVRKLAPDAHDGHSGLALVALNDGRIPDALKHASEALRCSPDAPYQRYLLGAALRASGDLERAEPHLLAGEGARVRWAEPACVRRGEFDRELALMNRGDQLAADAKLAEAAALYRQVLALRPEDGRVLSRLATVMAVMGQPTEGLELLDEALARAPTNYYLLMSKADVLSIAGRIPEARGVIGDAIEAWPQRAGAWIQLGALEVEARRPTEARRAFEQAHALEPANPKCVAQLAQQMVREGGAADAATLLEESLVRIGAPPRDLLVFMLQVQERAGRSDAVLRATRALIRRADGNTGSPSKR